MPCNHAPNPLPGETQNEANLREQGNRLTRMLCDLCGKVEEQGDLHLLSDETQAWWVIHKEFDLKLREAEEAARKAEVEAEGELEVEF